MGGRINGGAEHAPDETVMDETERNDSAGTGGTSEEEGSQMMLPLSRGQQMTRAEEAFPVEATSFERHSIDLRERVEDDLGHQLAAARARAGLTQADIASRLKLPIKLVERLEAGDYASISDGVFLRGYLASYARLVGIPVDVATRVADANSRTAPLVATGTISRTRYLFERYSVGATYLVLTAIIVVPAVWLATHGGLEQNLVRTTPLDPPARMMAPLAVPAQEGSATEATGTAAADAPATSATVPVGQGPVVASMTPFPVPAAPAPRPDDAPAAMESGTGRAIVLKLAQQSWVEITGADGRKIEYGMLAAGSEHEYRADGAVSVRIGNVQGAVLAIDGKPLDVASFQRGNVAHFRVLADGSASRPERSDQ